MLLLTMTAQVTTFPPGFHVYSRTVPDADFYLLGDMLQVGRTVLGFDTRTLSDD